MSTYGHGFLFVVFSGLAVGAAQPSEAQQAIRIGASIAISGRDAVQGGYVREGYLLCQKDVNEKGGVLGRPMEFVIRDDGSDPKTAAALYEKLIAEEKVDAAPTPRPMSRRSTRNSWWRPPQARPRSGGRGGDTSLWCSRRWKPPRKGPSILRRATG